MSSLLLLDNDCEGLHYILVHLLWQKTCLSLRVVTKALNPS